MPKDLKIDIAAHFQKIEAKKEARRQEEQKRKDEACHLRAEFIKVCNERVRPVFTEAKNELSRIQGSEFSLRSNLNQHDNPLSIALEGYQCPNRPQITDDYVKTVVLEFVEACWPIPN